MWWIFILLSAMFQSTTDIMRKRVLQHEHAMEFGAVRSLYNLAILSLVFAFFRPTASWDAILLMFFVAVILTSGMHFTNKSIRHMEISVVAPMANLSPLFLLVFAFFLLGETVVGWQWLGIFLLLAGGYILQVTRGKYGFLQPLKNFSGSKHLHFLVFAMVALSITAIMEKYLLETLQVSALSLLFYLLFFTSILFLGIDGFRYSLKETFADAKRDWKMVLPLSIFGIIAASFFYAGLAIAPVSLAVPFKRIGTLFTTIAGGKMFHEDHLWKKIIASVIMVAGAALLAM